MSNSAFTVAGVVQGGGGGGTVESVLGTAGRITSTGGPNPVIDIDSIYAGQVSIDTLGVVTTGTWQATLVSPAYGGSGVSNPLVHGILIGEAGSPFNSVVLANNELLVGVTGADPIGTLTPTGLTSIGVGNMVLSGNTIAATGALTLTTTANNDISLLPGGTGSVLLKADPTLPLGAVTKQYVDAIAAGLIVQPAALVATTANLNATYANGAAGVGATLTNAGAQAALTIDGVALSLTDRVLVKDQTAQEENGIYVVTDVGSGATDWELTRATNYDTAAEIQPGDLVIIQQGTANAITSWVETATVVTVGTDPIIFSQFTYSASITSVSGTAGRTSVTGTSNVTVDIDAAYVGQASITTVGALTSGSLATGFTPVTVPLGGTGATSFTAYSVLLAGATSTTALTNVSGVGTVGQVLTSNGAGMAPTWQAAGGGGSGNVVQIVSSGIIAGSSTTSTTYTDVTGATLSITPTSAANKILVIATWQQSTSIEIDYNTLSYSQMLRDATNISGADAFTTYALAAGIGLAAKSGQAFNYLDSPATTSAVTYKLQQRAFAAPSTTSTSSCNNFVITLMEVVP